MLFCLNNNNIKCGDNNLKISQKNKLSFLPLTDVPGLMMMMVVVVVMVVVLMMTTTDNR